MQQKNKNFSSWLIRLLGLLIGCIAAWIYHRTDISILNIVGIVYTKVGVTVIALIPLSVWAVYTAVKTGGNSEITLAYIGTTAQRVGLLGTVIGIVAATMAIGDNLSTGAATAVTGALPAVGQALVSTAVGFMISIICDFFIYVNYDDATTETIAAEGEG